MAENTQ